MKDLDFDELDRAVNSIMSGSKNANTNTAQLDSAPATQGGQAALPVPAENSDMPVPMATPPAESVSHKDEVTQPPSSSPESEPAVDRKSPVAARRGRFMDIVRPGATQSSDSVVPPRVSRQGAAVERSGPLVTDIIPSAPQPTAKKTSPIMPPTSTMAEPQKTTVTQETEWPDPLDMLQDDKPSESGHENQATAPLVSPFLSGAKVEKRPLGGTATSQETVEPAGDDSLVSGEGSDTNLQLTPNPADSTLAPLPEELSSDVMALESDANTIAMPADKVKTEVARQVAAQEDGTSTQEPLSVPSAPDKLPVEKEVSTAPVKTPVSSEPEPIVPKGPISIPQQYHEEPSTGDKESGSIYDTDTYHDQPLAHPKKKKSGWLWVFWIILILAIGAAGGAALYWLGVF